MLFVRRYWHGISLINDPQLQQMLMVLAERLKRHKGKKVYGYLSAGTKKLVDDIVDRLAQDSRIAEHYDLWYQQRDEIFKSYSRNPAERLPLSQNSEFKPIRNAVVQEAAKLIEMEHGQENRHPDYSPSIMPQALALLRQTAQIFQERFRDLDNQQMHRVDRKLQNKIAEKKLAQGQKLGG